MPEVSRFNPQYKQQCLQSLGVQGCTRLGSAGLFSQALAGGVNALHSRTCEGCWRMISTHSLCLLKCADNISVELKL